jgi:hypothetical protein
MRVVQKPGSKGSLKWIQLLVNQRPELLEEELRALVGSRESVEWLSPLTEDQFAEYRDGSALELLGVSKLRRPLRDFWPALGPQWDALARVGEALVLVEAKAHITELFSPPSLAKSRDITQEDPVGPGRDEAMAIGSTGARLEQEILPVRQSPRAPLLPQEGERTRCPLGFYVLRGRRGHERAH